MKKAKYKFIQPNHRMDGKFVEVGEVRELTEKQALGLANKVVLVEGSESGSDKEVEFNPATDKPTKGGEYRAVLEFREIEIPSGSKAADLKKLYEESEEGEVV